MLALHLNILLVLGVTVRAQVSVSMPCAVLLGVDTCRQGYRCEGGVCRPRGTSARCSQVLPCPNPFTHTCRRGQCVPVQQSGCLDCEFNPNSICEFDRCVTRPGAPCGGLTFQPCSSGHVCRRGICSPQQQIGCLDCEFNPGSICEFDRCVTRPGASCGGLNSQPCSSGHVCRRGICSPRQQTGCVDCEFNPGSICEINQCVRRPGASCGGLNSQPCSSGYVCRRGTCSRLQQSGCLDCGFTPGSICEYDQCVRGPGATCGRLYSQPCSSGHVCRGGVCSPRLRTCRRSSDCRPDERCHNGYCEPRQQQQRCDRHTPCNIGYRCQHGYCQPGSSQTTCNEWKLCPFGQTCRRGYCENVGSDVCDPNRGTYCGRGYSCVNYRCVPSDEPECGPNRRCPIGQDCRLGKCSERLPPPPPPPYLPHGHDHHSGCRNGRQCPRGHECISRQCIQVIV
ncbi:latent-transforming growth factor beta-binding protein 2-like [Ostrea edulis]|uniref:latent-transforming growth factor beta-binding protein 2-like n=1 Tax=Ostrea edulis TaxID=37623 RepID=UPI0024AFAF40|nr:latent-transforming growth factor beta-binding protein 2-like [Ostrea edulis]